MDLNQMMAERKFAFFTVFLVIFLIQFIVGPPVHPNDVNSDVHGANSNGTDFSTGLHYERYLQEVIKTLEDDPDFKQKLEVAEIEQITSGNISNELQFVNHRIRSRLDEIKRVEMQRLRKAVIEQAEMASNDINNRRKFRRPLHLDASNPNTFEIEDLKKLVIQTTKDMTELDKKRREEFKTYEMEKEHQYRESLQKMDDDHRKQAEQLHKEQIDKHKEHPKVHHPGSKQQLEDVWQKEDQLPVEDFDPKTFHQLHDINGDGFWDNDELNALFRQELQKMYEQGNTEDDMQEKYEEMNRMREHVVNETDINRDSMISLEEFIEMTRRKDFEEDPGWQGLESEEIFDEQEFQEYERRRMQGMVPPGAHMPVYIPDGVHPGAQYQHMPPPGHPQMPVYQQPPPHMGQIPQHQGSNQGYPPPQQQFQGGNRGYPPQQFPEGNQGYPPQQQQFQGGNQGYPPQQQFQGSNQGYQPQQQQFQGGNQGYQPQQHPGNEGYRPPQQQFQGGNIPNSNYQQQVPVANGYQQQQVVVNPNNIDPNLQKLPNHQETQANPSPQVSNTNPTQNKQIPNAEVQHQGETVKDSTAAGGNQVPDLTTQNATLQSQPPPQQNAHA